ncbi:MAG: tetratricopeptide repeat protein [Alphaproteobacteria bacterium]
MAVAPTSLPPAEAARLRALFAALDRDIARAPDAAVAAAARAILAAAVDVPVAVAAMTQRLLAAGRAGVAAETLGEAAAARPGDGPLANNAGVALLHSGQPEAAEPLLRRALAADPEFHEARVNLAACLARTGAVAEAASLLEAALAARGDSPAAWYNLGNLRLRLGRRPAARDAFAQAVARDPRHLGAQGRLLKLAKADLDFATAEAAHRRIDTALADGSGRLADLSEATGLAYETLFRPFTPAADAALRRTIAARLPHASGRAPPIAGDRPIRLGYMSANFGDHAVGHVTADLFGLHDRRRFTVHGFTWKSRIAEAAPYARRLRDAFDRVHDLDGAPAEAVAAAVAAAGIDILVDLEGMMDATAPAVLARRPAPVQVFWLGHAGSLGLPLADYLLADAIVVPPGEESRAAEAVVRLPGCYHCAARHPIGQVPPRSSLGLPEGAVVLAAFHNPEKIDRAILDRWMRILARARGTVLWLADPFDSAPLRSVVAAHAANAGVDPARIVTAGWAADRAAHLARLAAADLMLDTVTINASSTALDGLAAGLPLVATEGDRFASRISTSMLSAAGLGDLVTPDLDAYVALAVALAGDPARRAEQRRRVVSGRERLFDTRRFVGGLEAALAAMAERQRRGLPPTGFAIGQT